MKFEDIPKRILLANNTYEKENDIETLNVELISGEEKLDWAIFKAEKSDKTNTLFFAWKHKRSSGDSWWWFCPSKNHIHGLKELDKIYWVNEDWNKKSRITIDQLPEKLVDFMLGGLA